MPTNKKTIIDRLIAVVEGSAFYAGKIDDRYQIIDDEPIPFFICISIPNANMMWHMSMMKIFREWMAICGDAMNSGSIVRYCPVTKQYMEFRSAACILKGECLVLTIKFKSDE